MSATTIALAEIDRLIGSVVGPTEAADIDLEHVTRGTDGALYVGDQSRDGCLTIGAGDTVTVWAQGVPHTAETVPGAYAVCTEAL